MQSSSHHRETLLPGLVRSIGVLKNDKKRASSPVEVRSDTVPYDHMTGAGLPGLVRSNFFDHGSSSLRQLGSGSRPA